MFASSLHQALLFSISTIFNVYIIIVLFRFMLQLTNNRLYNPLALFAHKATELALKPIHKIIPPKKNLDLAALLLAFIMQMVELYLILLVSGVYLQAGSIGGLCIWSLGELLDLLCVFLMFAIVIQVVASWLQPGQYNPGTAAFISITEPLLTKIRRILPNFGMLDFSPMVALFLLYLARIIISAPIIVLGKSLI